MTHLRYLSVCSGIEAASVAWQPLGWQLVGVAEIEPFPAHVLHHRFGASRPMFMPPPDAARNLKEQRARANAIRSVARIPEHGAIPNFGDLNQFHRWPDAAVDVLVGGTPCQSFSVAGLRQGLRDPRGNLALVYLALADRYRPAGWSGRMSPVFCHQMEDGTLAPSSEGWRNSGMGSPGECWTLNTCEHADLDGRSPSDGDVCSLSDILETGDVPQRYYLTAKACAGIPASP